MFKGTRVRFRARWWFAADAILLALAAKGELDAVTAAQLSEYASEGVR